MVNAAIEYQRSENARNAELAQRELERETVEAQRNRELELARQRDQADALQAYLDEMGQLLLDEVRPLRQSATASELRPETVDDQARTLARVRTLTVLPRLNGERKRSILQFLYESSLIIKGHVVVALKGADLTAADLTAANLSRADLGEVDLSKAELHAVNLGEADLENADLTDASLSAANLHGVYLGGAYVRRAYLHATNLLRANLSSADLSEAYLHAANLHKVDLTGAYLSDANLSGADLRDADLSGADLRRTDLSDADLRDADLSGADLRDVNPIKTYLSALILRRANLSGADLRDGDFRDADLREADLRDADLSGADLRNADLRRADLRATNLSGANLSGTDLKYANLGLANLSGADLRDADLRATNLSLSNLSRVDLSGADLRDADLTVATMPNGQNYEDWLETIEGQQWLETYKEGRGKDREISVPDTMINATYPAVDDLHLRIDLGACRFEARPGEGEGWVAGTYHYPTGKRAPKIRTEGGLVTITEAELTIERIPAEIGESVPRYELEFGKDKERPFAITIETGPSEFDLDLGGVPLKALTVRQGAGRFNLDFSAPNPHRMSLLEISSGAAGMELENLANANFSRMRLSGMAASYELDFGGRLLQPADVTIETALAGVEIAVPGSTAARIVAGTTSGSVDVGDGLTKRAGAFLTEAAMAGKKPLLTIHAGVRLGALQIRAT
jgi:uncharacterized protein YjbI with pentapeptide repeats